MATPLYVRSGGPVLWVGAGTVDFQYWSSIDGGSFTVKAESALDELAFSTPIRLETTIGTGAGTTQSRATVAGPTTGRVWPGWTNTTAGLILSPPLAADVTVSGTVTFNICAHENAMAANATIAALVYRWDHGGNRTLVADGSFVTELTTSNARNTFTATPTPTDFKKGDRILLLLYIDDGSGVTMASGNSVVVTYNGANASTADTNVTFTETITFTTSDPAGSTYYLRDTSSAISGFKELSTTQGSGTATAVHASLNGPITAPGDVWTATSGGSDIEWMSPQYNAFTLGGVVKVLIGRGSDVETSSNSMLRCEIAICNSDGSSPTVWARSYTHYEVTETAPDIAFAHYITGPDTAVSTGQRLRFRFYSDDPNDAENQGAGTDYTIRYDGTSTYATALTFTQSITEAATTFAFPFPRNDRRIVPLI